MNITKRSISPKGKPIIPIGTKTQWGTIEAVGLTGGERYYWMAKGRCVAMVPAFIVEKEHDREKAAKA